MYVLVRHAHAGDKKRWTGNDVDRPLSGRGVDEAKGLLIGLRDVAPSGLVSSPYLRCIQTLEPLARRTSLSVRSWDLLRPDADIERLDEQLNRPENDGIVFCSHGETLTGLVSRWEAARDLNLVGRPTGQDVTPKGAAWIVTTAGRRIEARYVRPHRAALYRAQD